MRQSPKDKITLKCFRSQNIILLLRSQSLCFRSFIKSNEINSNT